MEKNLASSEWIDFWVGRKSENQIYLQIFNSIHNDSHQCYSIILLRLAPGVREMNQGVRRKNSDTSQYLVCPPYAAKTARQRRPMLQISF